MTSPLLIRGWPPEHPVAVRAQGRYIWTADGRRLLDGASGGLAATLGYAVPEIAAAVAGQAASLPSAHSLAFTTEIADSCAAALASRLPDGLDRPLFVTGGTEAIEMALLAAHRIQVARGQPQRTIFLARHLSYHGSSLATLGLGGRVGLRGPVAALLPSYPHLPPPYPYRPEWHRRFPEPVQGVPGLADHLGRPLGEAAAERGRSDPAEALAVAIEALGPERVCAFVAEPVIGASAGAVVPDPDYWRRIDEICDRTGVLWIADEVMTGMGRAGTWLASELFGVVPDIVALGKGIAAAHQPLGAVVIREADWQELSATAPGFPWGFTFAHHPVTLAAGRSVLEYIDRHRLLARSTAVGARLREQILLRLREHPNLGEVRGVGLLVGVELVADRERRQPFPPEREITRRILEAAVDAGVLFYPARGGADGIAGDAFLVAPALTVTDAECDELVDAVVAAVHAVLGG